MGNFSWSSVCSRVDREGATNRRKQDAAKPTRVGSQESGRSERTHAPWPPRPGHHASRRHGDSTPAEVVPDAGTELTTGGERAPSSPPRLPRSSPRRGPAFRISGEGEKQRRDRTRKATRTLRPGPRETPEAPPSLPAFPAPTLGSHSPQEERRCRRGGGAVKGRDVV